MRIIRPVTDESYQNEPMHVDFLITLLNRQQSKTIKITKGQQNANRTKHLPRAIDYGTDTALH
jgi:hypothetical protein